MVNIPEDAPEAQSVTRRAWQSREMDLLDGGVSISAVLYANPISELQKRTQLPLWRIVVTSAEIVVHCRGFSVKTQEDVYELLRALNRAAARAEKLKGRTFAGGDAANSAARKYASSIVSRHDGVYFLRNKMILRPPSEADALIAIVRERWWASGAYRRA